MRKALTSLIAAAFILIASGRCAAHVARTAVVVAQIHPDGTYRLTVTFDLMAYLLNDTPERVGDPAMNALLDGPASVLRDDLAEAKDRFASGIVVVRGTTTSVTFPDLAAVEAYKASGNQPRLPVMMDGVVKGQLPLAATSVAFHFPEVLGPVVLTVERPGKEPMVLAVDADVTSDALPVKLTQPVVQRSAEPSKEPPLGDHRVRTYLLSLMGLAAVAVVVFCLLRRRLERPLPRA